MKTLDETTLQLDVIARLLELHGFALEVNYSTATIIVWAEQWPLLLEVQRKLREIEQK